MRKITIDNSLKYIWSQGNGPNPCHKRKGPNRISETESARPSKQKKLSQKETWKKRTGTRF